MPEVELAALMVPAPLSDQETPRLVLLVTVGVMLCVWLADKLAVGGDTEIETAGGVMVYNAEAMVLSLIPLL